MLAQDAGRPGACQNWEQGCGNCELGSELGAWERSSLGEAGVGLFWAVVPGGCICNPTFLQAAAAAAAKSIQSCPTLCDPIDGSPPGSPVPGILQARTLEWVAISFSNACKWKVKVESLSRVWLFATYWILTLRFKCLEQSVNKTGLRWTHSWFFFFSV